MKKADKFFGSIIIGIVLLMLISLVFIFKPSKSVYLPEDEPEGVMHNYFLSLQEEDYARTYNYLSPDLPGYPKTIQAFKWDIQNNFTRFDDLADVTISINSSEVKGSQATVIVREIRFYEGDIFSSGQQVRTLEFELVLDEGEWKIVNASSVNRWGNIYFLQCWTTSAGCN